MKKLLKFLKFFILVIILLLIILSVVAKLKETEITAIAVKKLSAAVKAPMEIGDVSFTLIRRFPYATIEFKNVWLGSYSSSTDTSLAVRTIDTIARINKLYISVKTIPLLKRIYEIARIEISGADIKYMADKNGASNFDFLMDTTKSEKTDTTVTTFNLLLSDLKLKNINCYYSDSAVLASAKVFIPDIKLNGKIKDNIYAGSVDGSIKLTNCSFKSTNIYLMQETEIDFDAGYVADSVSIKKLRINTDGAELDVSGSMILRNDIYTDFEITGEKIKLAQLQKYIPGEILRKTGIKKISGTLEFDANVKGIVSDSIVPNVELKILMKNGTVESARYPALKNITFKGFLTNGFLNNNQTTNVVFDVFHFETDKSKADFTFSVQNIDQPKYKIVSNLALELGEFKGMIPDSLIQKFEGNITASIDTKGQLPDSIDDGFIDYILDNTRADFSFKHLYIKKDSALSVDSLSGHLAWKPGHINIDRLTLFIPSNKIAVKNTSVDIQLTGKLSNAASMGFDLKSFYFDVNNCILNGSAKLNGFINPTYEINTTIKLSLGEIKKLIPDSLLTGLSGEIIADINSKGKINLDSISSQVNQLIYENSDFSVGFNNVSVDLPDTLVHIKNFSGKLKKQAKNIEINDMHGAFSGVDFSIDSTKIVNLYNTIIKNQPENLFVQGIFKLGDIDYTMFAPFISQTGDTAQIAASEENKAPEPKKYTYQVKGKLKVNKFIYKNAITENISALFNLTDSLYIVDKFKFNGFGGSVNTSVRYTIKRNENILWVKNNIEKMNVARLLKDMDNFKEFYEPAITSDNLSGVLSARSDAQIFFLGDSLIRNKMYFIGDLKLEKGGIYNYPPVQEVAPLLPGIDNLNILEFKTINSNIFIFQDAIYVPVTLIVSNKLDASALGMKSFGEDYSYHFMVFLSDIITGKSPKINKKQNTLGDEVTQAGREGIRIKSFSLNGKIGSRPEINNKERDEMQRKVKASERLLNLRFNPNIINYETGVK